MLDTTDDDELTILFLPENVFGLVSTVYSPKRSVDAVQFDTFKVETPPKLLAA